MFRIGTTSYIIPADILPNVEYLAPLVDDVELVLFETDEYGSNLPDAGLSARLAALAAGACAHLHGPLAAGPASGRRRRRGARVPAQGPARRSRPPGSLAPYAYVLHLDGRALLEGISPAELAQWQANARRALGDPLRLGGRACAGSAWRISSAGTRRPLRPWSRRSASARTIDVGHLWLQGVDPLIHLERWIDRTRVIHLHGIGERDHAVAGPYPGRPAGPGRPLPGRAFRRCADPRGLQPGGFRGVAASAARVPGARDRPMKGELRPWGAMANGKGTDPGPGRGAQRQECVRTGPGARAGRA